MADGKAVEASASASGELRSGGFRSWVEDYRRPESEQPIDREAFRFRAAQRGRTRSVASDGARAKNKVGTANFHFVRAEVEAARAAAARRTDPVLCAQLHLQKRGYIVTRAATLVRGATGWKVGGRPGTLTDDELIALAAQRGCPA